MVCDAIRSPLTGVGRMALTLLRELHAQGRQVIGLDSQANPLLEGLVDHCAVLPPRLPWLRTAVWHLDLLRRLPELELPPHILLDPTDYPNALGQHPRQAVFVHDLSMFQAGVYRLGKRTWFRALWGRSLQKAQLCICISQDTRQQLLQHYPLDPQRCVVVANSLDPAFAAAADQARTEQAKASAAGQDQRAPYFLVVGTLEQRKNLPRLLQAYAQARKAGLKTRLVLAGGAGHGSRDVLSRIQEPDLQPHVQHVLTPTDAELIQLYLGAQALLFPSLQEGFGLPILEAMHCGIPVLTSNCSAMPEVAGEAALLVDPLDATALSTAMLRLAGEPQLRQDLVQSGRLRVQEFSPQRSALRLSWHLDQLSQQLRS